MGAVCERCGAPLTRATRLGLCARCLIEGALGAPVPIEEPEHGSVKAVPPSFSETGAASSSGMLFSIPGHAVLCELARGGMGVVYRARQFEPEREVALKVLQASSVDSPELRQRFIQEAQTMAALDHPAILPVFQVGDVDGLPWFTMKLAQGGTLATRGRNLAGQWRTIAELLADLCDAVQYAHDHGVLHRDLKPGNVLFDEGHRPYVADFGLAKLLRSDAPLTVSVGLLGTPLYLAPEIAARDTRSATIASDVYALGAILYELLAGRPPFTAQGVHALLREIAETEPAPPSRLFAGTTSSSRARMPADLEVVCLTCLAKEPAKRYSSARELGFELRRWLAGEPILARPATIRERVQRWTRKNRKLTGALASITLLACSLIVSLSISARREARSAEKLKQNLYAADVALAGLSLERGDHEIARRLLARHEPTIGEPDLRGLEWRLLTYMAQGDSPWGMEGHTSVVTGVALSRDGRKVFSTALDGTIREWDFASAQPGRHWIPAVTQRFSGLTYVGDGEHERLLAIDGTGPLAVLVDLASGAIRQFTNRPVHAAVFTPDKTRFVRGKNGGFYANDDGLEIVRLDGEIERTVPFTGNRFAFSPDGRRLATGTWHNRLRVWQWPEMKQFVELGPSEAAVSLDFAGDGVRLVSSGFNGTLKLWDSVAGKLITSVTAHRGTTVGCARFSPDGKWLATAGGDQVLCIWEAQTLKLKRMLKGHVDQVWALAWTPDGTGLLSTSRRYGIRFWPFANGPDAPPGSGAPGTSPGQPEIPLRLAAQPLVFSADSKWIGLNLVGEEGVVILDRVSGKEQARYTNDFVLAGFDPDDNSLVGVNHERTMVRRLAFADHGPVVRATVPLEDSAGRPWGAQRLVLFPGAKHLLINQLGEDLRIYDTATGRLRRKIPISRTIDTAAVPLDRRRFLVSTSRSEVEVYQLDSDQPLARLRGHGTGPLSVAVSPDGRRFASADWDGLLRVYDAETFALLLDLTQFDGGGPMAFSRDGMTLAKADSTRLHFVQLATGRIAASLPVQITPNDTLAISPNDNTIALIDRSGELRFWHAPRERGTAWSQRGDRAAPKEPSSSTSQR